MINLNVDFRFGEFYLATLAMTLRLLRFLIVGIALLITTWATCFVIAGTNYSWSAYATAMVAMMGRRAGHLWTALFIVSMAILVYFAVALVRDDPRGSTTSLIIVVGLAVLATLFKFLWPQMAGRDFVRKNRAALGPVHLQVNESGVSAESSAGQAKISWDAYQRVRETNSLFLLYTQSDFASIVPKRCFEQPDDINRFRKLVQAHCSGVLELQK